MDLKLFSFSGEICQIKYSSFIYILIKKMIDMSEIIYYLHKIIFVAIR